MHDLIPVTPLGGTSAHVENIGDLRISENVDRALASVSARVGEFDKLDTAIRETTGTALPGTGGITQNGDYSFFWTGPGQWMAEAPITTHEDISALLKGITGPAASVTEQTGGWVRFDVAGPSAVSMFERLCALDTGSMASNTASRTSVEHVSCFVLCREEGRDFSVIGPVSMAGSLHHALTAAAWSIS